MICFLLLQISLQFLQFYVNGITHLHNQFSMESFFFSVLPLTLHTMILRFTHVVCIKGPFLFIAECCSMAWTYHNLFFHSPADEPLGYFQCGAVTDKVSLNTHMQVFLWTYALCWVSIFIWVNTQE